MDERVEKLARAILEQHAREGPPVVDESVFGTGDPVAIAAQVGSFCRAHLGASVALPRFYLVSVGCVVGLDLEDGRSIVVKVQRGTRDGHYLAACLEVRRQLAAAGFPCPRPIAGPIRLGAGNFTSVLPGLSSVNSVSEHRAACLSAVSQRDPATAVVAVAHT